MMFNRTLKLLYQQVLSRRIPHTLFCWRFMLPAQPFSVRLHRHVFLNAWPRLPRSLWLAIVLYSITLWYGFYAWYYSIRNWWKHRAELLPVSSITQMLDLLYLALLHSIPPGFYYSHRLYLYPRCHWLNFVYSHELPHWHQILSPVQTPESQTLLSDKQLFSQFMHEKKLSSVPTQWVLTSDSSEPDAKLFSQKKWFIKPNSGHGAFGCMLLHYSTELQSYELLDFLSHGQLATGKIAIQGYLTSQKRKHELLVQNHLQNHPDLDALFGSRELITVRLISGLVDDQYQPLLAVLEIPLQKEPQRYLMIQVDCTEGVLLLPDVESLPQQQQGNDEINRLLAQLQQATLPHWHEIHNLCCQAHAVLSDPLIIGWDIILSHEGAMLLEANHNWGVVVHQRAPQGPLLQGAILKHYRQQFKHL